MMAAISKLMTVIDCEATITAIIFKNH